MVMPIKPPSRFGVLLFPGFQLLDVCGPVDSLNVLGLTIPIDIALIAAQAGPVSTAASFGANRTTSCSEELVATHSIHDAPQIEVLLVPGGMGVRGPLQEEVDYIKRVYPTLKYLITVCTGSALVARSGVLDGRKATSNKRSWEFAISQRPNVDWVHKARWVKDGNIYTSSGVSAGIDAFFQLIEDVCGSQMADEVAGIQEYRREKDSLNDPFANV